jgi:hypothetical protein
MPVNGRSNNRILPSNSRTVDVARQALQDYTGIQQRKYANAFEVDSYESVVYTRLTSGTPCSCQAHRKSLATLLDEDGKMKEGTMNELLTGLQFKVQRYGTRAGTRPEYRADAGLDPLEANVDQPQQEALLPGGRRLTDADYVAIDLDDEVATELVSDTEVRQAVNGPVRQQTIDDLVGDFDTDINMSDSSCLVCYGSGFVGGYSVLGGWRHVLSTQWHNRPEVIGTIEANKQPHSFFSTRVIFEVTLPKGFVYLDCFRFWNNLEQVVPQNVQIDDLDYSPSLFAAMCDGRPHFIKVTFEDLTYWTHLEIQVCQTRHPARIEFPKMTKGSDLRFEDSTETVQINASPLVPNLGPQDVIVESSRGKAFLVSSATFWNDSKRNVHGWDCNARVVQPSEMVGLLPRRRKLSQQASQAVRDNVNGTRRT